MNYTKQIILSTSNLTEWRHKTRFLARDAFVERIVALLR